MRILLVAATAMEIAGVSEHIAYNGQKLDFFITRYGNHEINTLVTGIGSVATSYGLSQVLSQAPFDLIINIGLAGSYDPDLPLCSVYQVTKDRFGDLGALDRDESILDLYDLQLADSDIFPYTGGWLIPSKSIPILNLTPKTSVTLNTTSGSPTSISRFKQKYDPDLETMEGAAVFYVAKMKDITVIQLRAISNYVTLRDRSSWQIKEAMTALTTTTIMVLDTIK